MGSRTEVLTLWDAPFGGVFGSGATESWSRPFSGASPTWSCSTSFANSPRRIPYSKGSGEACEKAGGKSLCAFIWRAASSVFSPC